VYNGADFVDLKKNFRSDKFTAIVIHLPFEFCITWELDVQLQEKEKEVQEKVEREIVLQEALQEKAIALQEALQEAINLRAQLFFLTKIQPEISKRLSNTLLLSMLHHL
jgi:hypothetical protein